MNKQIASDRLRIGVLGFGGLGQAAARNSRPQTGNALDCRRR